MEKSERKGGWRSIGLVGFLFLIMMLYGLAMGMHGSTVVEWWIPVSVAVVLALVSGTAMWRLWRWITLSDGFAVNYACHAVVATGLLLAAFYGLNYAFADDSTLHTEQVTVDRRYSETRHRTRRIGRRVHTQGEPYKVYFADVRLADGRTKKMSVTLKQYNRLKTGSAVRLTVERGLFGVPVIKREGRLTEVPPSSYRLGK